MKLLHSVNFQLQAMVLTVIVGSMVVFGLLFKIVKEFSEETIKLRGSVELTTLLEDWDRELIVGARSRVIYVTMRRQIYLQNYQRSLVRINELSRKAREIANRMGSPIKDSLSLLLNKEVKYQSLAVSLEKDLKDPYQFEQDVELLKIEEKELRDGVEYFTQGIMVGYRNKKLQSIDDVIHSSKNLIFIMALAFVLINLIIWLSMRHKILTPLKVLEKGAKRIGEGELGLQLRVNTKGEIRDLVTVLNKMSSQLKREQDAQALLQKIETIGQVAISVNHEINNPLQIILGNAEYLNRLLGTTDLKIEKKLNSILKEVKRISEVTKKLREIKNPVVDNYIGDDVIMIDIEKSG